VKIKPRIFSSLATGSLMLMFLKISTMMVTQSWRFITKLFKSNQIQSEFKRDVVALTVQTKMIAKLNQRVLKE